MNHKRRRPKDRRSGCLLCKPHKSNGRKDQCESQTMQERRALIGDTETDVSPSALREARATERLAAADLDDVFGPRPHYRPTWRFGVPRENRMRLTVKLRDGSRLVTAHADLEGEPTQDLCDLALAITSKALVEGTAATEAFASHQEKSKTSRLGAGVRGRTAIRDPLPDIE